MAAKKKTTTTRRPAPTRPVDAVATATDRHLRALARAARIGMVLARDPKNALRAEYARELDAHRTLWRGLAPDARTAVAQRAAAEVPDLTPAVITSAVATLED